MCRLVRLQKFTQYKKLAATLRVVRTYYYHPYYLRVKGRARIKALMSSDFSTTPREAPRLVSYTKELRYRIKSNIILGSGLSGNVYGACAYDPATRSTSPTVSFVAKTAGADAALSLIIEAVILRFLHVRSTQSPKCAQIYENHIPKIREVYIPRYLRTGALKFYCDMFENAEREVQTIDADARARILRSSGNETHQARTAIHEIRDYLGLSNDDTDRSSMDWVLDVMHNSNSTRDVEENRSKMVPIMMHETVMLSYDTTQEAKFRSEIAACCDAAVQLAMSLRNSDDEEDQKRAAARLDSSSDDFIIEDEYMPDGPVTRVVHSDGVITKPTTLDDDDHVALFGDTCYIVMDRYETNAQRVLDSPVCADMSQRAEFCREMYHAGLSALLMLHSLGFVHRDLKPENFFVTRRAGDASQRAWHIVLGDYGFGVSQFYSWYTDEVFPGTDETLLGSFVKRLPEKAELCGNQRYSSWEAQCGLPPRCLWDIESLLYVISASLFKSLPWVTEHCYSNRGAPADTVSKPGVPASRRGLHDSFMRRKGDRTATYIWILNRLNELANPSMNHLMFVTNVLIGFYKYAPYSALFEPVPTNEETDAIRATLSRSIATPTPDREVDLGVYLDRRRALLSIISATRAHVEKIGIAAAMGNCGIRKLKICERSCVATVSQRRQEDPVLACNTQIYEEEPDVAEVGQMTATREFVPVPEIDADRAQHTQDPTPGGFNQLQMMVVPGTITVENGGDRNKKPQETKPHLRKKQVRQGASVLSGSLSLHDLKQRSLRKFRGYGKWDPVSQPWHAWLPSSEKRQRRAPRRYQ